MAEYQKNARELEDSLMFFRKMRGKPSFLSDLNYSEMMVFGALMRLTDDNEQVKMNDISNLVDISKPALSQIVNKLEDKELVERIYSKEDRRATFLSFTPKGQEIYKINRNHMIAMSNAIVEKLGNDDTEELIRLLKRLFHIFEEVSEEHRKQGVLTE